MKRNWNRNGYGQAGFTLVEMVVVVAIVAVLLGIGVPSVAGYMVSSEMIKLNQSAKTIYLSAQDYLTQATAAGTLPELNAQAGAVPLGGIVPAVSDQELNDNLDNIGFLRLSKSGTDDAALRQALERFMGDKPMLDQSILVEYNKKTGVVRSVFYSERADTLDYSGGGNTNVLDRTEAALRDKRQGYYGVVYTGKLGDRASLEAPEVELLNEDRLVLRWSDITPSGGMDILSYTVTIYSKDWQTEYLRIAGIPSPMKQLAPGEPSLPGSLENAMAKRTELATYWNGVEQTDPARRGHALAKLSPEATGTDQTVRLALVLDDIHESIFDRYPTIPPEEINVLVEPALDWIQSPPGKNKTPAHAYFGNPVTKPASLFADTKPAQIIVNARHLNNIRYAAPTNDYQQTADIDLAKLETAPCKHDKNSFGETVAPAGNQPYFFEVISFQYHDYNNGVLKLDEGKPVNRYAPDGYQGRYQALKNSTSKNYQISSMVLAQVKERHMEDPISFDKNSNIGMFSKLNQATLENLTLSAPILLLDQGTAGGTALKSFSNVGFLAGFAKEAKLTGCGVIESANAPRLILEQGGASSCVGGVVGLAESSTFEKVISDVQVQAGMLENRSVKNGSSFVGGIVGKLTGTAGQKSLVNQSRFTMNVAGGDNVGGVAGYLDSYSSITSSELKENQSRIMVFGYSNVGGIAGFNDGGNLTGNVSSIKDFDKDSKLSAALNLLKGGNTAAFEAAAITIPDKNSGGEAGGVIGRDDNVGGLVGKNEGTISGAETLIRVSGRNAVGGVVGLNGVDGKIDSASGKILTDGLVISGGDNGGGIIGVNENGKNAAGAAKNMTLQNLTSQTHVIAKQYAGGIVGSNGLRSDSNTYNETLRIQSCTVKGVVYAYQNYGGGIAGCNTGVIDNCTATNTTEGLIGEETGLALGNYIGGIAGYNSGRISSCTSNTLVTGKNYVGGIIGQNDRTGTMAECSTKGGKVVAQENYVGGLIGLNTTNQFSDPDDLPSTSLGGLESKAALVKGKNYVGGVIGCNLSDSGVLAIQAVSGLEGEKVNDCKVQGEAFVGGIIGYNGTSQQMETPPDPYSDLFADSGTNGTTILQQSKNHSSVQGTRYVGGIIGLNHGGTTLELVNCTNNGSIQFAEGKLTADEISKIGGFYYIAGITGRNTSTGLIDTCINNGDIVKSPSLYAGGLVEVNEGVMYNCTNGGNFKDASRNHVGGIAGLNRTLDQPTAKLDDETFEFATIKECSNNKGLILGKSFVGGITADNHAVILDCAFSTAVNANSGIKASGNCVGGITGYNGPEGKILSSESKSGVIIGANMVGGVVGYSEPKLDPENGNETVFGGADADHTLVNGALVFGNELVGGVVGYAPHDKIQYCENLETAMVVAKADAKTPPAAVSVTESGFVRLGSDGSVSTGQTQTLTVKRQGVGGITGTVEADQVLADCLNEGSVLGAASPGGIAGTVQESGAVQRSVNRGTVISTTNGSEVQKTLSINSVTQYNNVAGGIAGANYGSITACSVDDSLGGGVQGAYQVGGLVGVNYGAMTDCQAVAPKYSVVGIGQVGGLVGSWEDGEIAAPPGMKRVEVTVRGAITGRKFVKVGVQAVGSSPSVGGVFGQSVKEIDGYTFAGRVSYDQQRLPENQTENVYNNQLLYAGGIVGRLNAGGTVKNCTLASGATVSGNPGNPGNPDKPENLPPASQLLSIGVGGIVGYNDGMLIGCKVETDAQLKGTHCVGGYIGSNASNGQIDHVANRGLKIESTGNYVGGYIGSNLSSTALVRPAGEPLENEAQVSGGSFVGGVVGVSWGNLAYCNNAAAGTVRVGQGGNSGGGVAGVVNRSSAAADQLTVSNCVNRGRVEALVDADGAKGAAAMGGIVGRVNGTDAAKAAVQVLDCGNEGTVFNGRNVGGIVGELLNKSSVLDCTNQAGGTVSTSDANVGGIVGNARQGSIERCVNLGVVTGEGKSVNNSISAGGIVGYGVSLGPISDLDQPDTALKVIDCVNQSPINLPEKHSVGGILGMGNTVSLEGCENKASVAGSVKVGGIAGAFTYSYGPAGMSASWALNCVNDAAVTGKDLVGGIVGSMDNRETLYAVEGCHNTAQGVVTVASGTQGTGGIVGGESNNQNRKTPSRILNCVNDAEIKAGGAVQKLGGIIGYTGSPILVSGCTNNGTINGASAQFLGGIAGYVAESEVSQNALITNCSNFASVISDNSSVGGIVGFNHGRVLTCNNGTAGTAAVIQGGGSVGGLVGTNQGVTAQIYIDNNSGFNSNFMNVTAANGYAGGAVGSNIGGWVHRTFNAGKVESTNGRAGGLIGLAANDQGKVPVAGKYVAGSLENSVNVGDVVSKEKLGGVVGMRQDAYNSETCHKIINSLYYTGKITEANSISVGNETDQNRTVSSKDAPIKEHMVGLRQITDEILKANNISILNWNNPEEVFSKIGELIGKWEYKLPQPINVSTESDEAYKYNTSWTIVQGAVKGYDVYLRSKDGKQNIPVGSVDGSDVDAEGRLKASLQFDIREVYNGDPGAFHTPADQTLKPIGSFEDIIGIQYDVVVVTRGINGAVGDQVVNAQDSEEEVCETNRYILPPLPTPGGDDATTIQIVVGEKKVYSFTIPSEDYKELIDRTMYPNLEDLAAYKKSYEEGMTGFRVYQMEEGKKGNQLALVLIDPNDPYRFTIDHSKLDPKITQLTIGIQAVSKQTVTDYAHSELAICSYIIQQRLPAPTNLTATFKAAADNHPTYNLTWKEVEHAEWYRVTVKYLDENNQEQTYVMDKIAGTSCNWDINTVTLGKDVNKVSYTVEAVGQDENPSIPKNQVVYLTSLPSDPLFFDVPLRLPAPELSVAAAGATEDEDNKYQLQWKFEGEPGKTFEISGYDLVITSVPIDDPTAAPEPYTILRSPQPADRSLDLVFQDAQFGRIYTIRMVAKGVLSKSMDSAEALYTFTLYPRLPQPSKLLVSTAVSNPDTDQDKLSFVAQWDRKDASQNAYPAEATEFRLLLYSNSTSGETFVKSIPVTLDATGNWPLDLYELKDEAVREYNCYLVANKVPGKYEQSKQSPAYTLMLLKQLPHPGALTATPAPDAIPITDYPAAKALDLGWTPYRDANVISLMKQIGSYSIEVELDGVDITGELTVPPAGLALDAHQAAFVPQTSSVQVAAPLAYAGKEVTIRWRARGGATAALDSPVVEQKVTLPKAQLVAPAVAAVQPVDSPDPADDQPNPYVGIAFTQDASLAKLLQSLSGAENADTGDMDGAAGAAELVLRMEGTYQLRDEDGNLIDPPVELSVKQIKVMLELKELLDDTAPDAPAFKTVKLTMDQIEQLLKQAIIEQIGGSPAPEESDIELTLTKYPGASVRLLAASGTAFTDSAESVFTQRGSLLPPLQLPVIPPISSSVPDQSGSASSGAGSSEDSSSSSDASSGAGSSEDSGSSSGASSGAGSSEDSGSSSGASSGAGSSENSGGSSDASSGAGPSEDSGSSSGASSEPEQASSVASESEPSGSVPNEPEHSGGSAAEPSEANASGAASV